MPLGIAVSEAEIEVAQTVFRGVRAPLKIKRGIIEFKPQDARKIVNKLLAHETNAATRLLNRVIDLTGPSYFDGDTNPVDEPDNSDHIEVIDTVTDEPDEPETEEDQADEG